MIRIEYRTGRGCDTPRLHQKEIGMEEMISGDSDEESSCKKDIGGGIKFHSQDMVFNDCPVVTKARVTFLCRPQ